MIKKTRKIASLRSLLLLSPSSLLLFSLDRLQKNQTLLADGSKKPFKGAGENYGHAVCIFTPRKFNSRENSKLTFLGNISQELKETKIQQFVWFNFQIWHVFSFKTVLHVLGELFFNFLTKNNT